GATAVVYEAHDLKDQTTVALKVGPWTRAALSEPAQIAAADPQMARLRWTTGHQRHWRADVGAPEDSEARGGCSQARGLWLQQRGVAKVAGLGAREPGKRFGNGLQMRDAFALPPLPACVRALCASGARCLAEGILRIADRHVRNLQWGLRSFRA
ncbi:unnamed protein product, partial [Ostreobium quekettii]